MDVQRDRGRPLSLSAQVLRPQGDRRPVTSAGAIRRCGSSRSSTAAVTSEGFRSGTVAVPLVVGLGAAVELAVGELRGIPSALDLRIGSMRGWPVRVPGSGSTAIPPIVCRAI